jgi:hypothetical protein
MNCEKYLNLIDDLIEGELGAPRAGQVNSHLLACPSCAARCKTLEREKEIYARYLFDVEPPTDLWTKFQAKLETEAGTVSQIRETPSAASVWKTGVSRFFRLYPALGFALAVAAFGIGFWKLAAVEKIGGDEYIAEKQPENIPATILKPDEINRVEAKDLPAKDELDETGDSPKAVKTRRENGFLDPKRNSKTTNKLAPVKTPKTNETAVSGDKKQKPPIVAQPTEEQLRQARLSALEKATTRQMEKIELLLRSFRNARVVEGANFYDVGYEKQQARKLLEKNVRLRQMAENYGTLYTEEILDRVEPLLLDISNLENNPLPEKVLDIKERVRNQNIIASLQIY